MHPRAAALMAAGDGLITRRGAVSAGVPACDIDRLVATGEWYAVRRGVYCRSSWWAGLDPYRGRPLAECRAAGLSMVVPAVASHDWAALELGIDLLRPRRRMPHVTRFGVLGSRTKHGVKHHTAPFGSGQVRFVGERPVLDPARTVADLAREHGLRHGLVAADSARRHGTSLGELEAAVLPMRHWPGVRTVRLAVALSDPGAEGPAESLARLLVLELGHDDVETQFGLTDGSRVAWCDLRVGRHVIEVDGRLKYRAADAGGVATRDAADVLWAEKVRQDWLCGFGLGISRLVWDDLQASRWDETKRRLDREISLTEARLGRSVADLERFRVRRPRRTA